MPLTTIDRRSFLRRSAIGGVGLALGGSALLAACGSDSKSSASGDAAGDLKYGDLDYQLAWIKNFEFTGSYFADSKRYYQYEGVGVTLVPAGPTTAIEPQVVSKKAFIATSYSEVTAASI